MRRTHVLCLFIFMIGSISSFAQKSITGKIVDEKGEPLVGVTVLVKGTTDGISSDADGKYSVAVAEGSTLSFSYIGYLSKEVKVASQKVINVVLSEDNKTLNEVVVIGYGSMTRKDVTSSITTLKSDKLNTGVYTDPGQLLQGKVPGLTVVQSSDPTAGTTSISLRGASSFRTGVAMEPYYVVDGIPGMSLNLIAPDDIESIDVLRDASATAIYGSKAANGVVVITTKKGSKTDRSSVTYSGYVGFDKIAKRLDMMSASDLLAYAADNDITLPNDEGYNTNWNDEVLRTAVSQNHNVSINGGSERSSYNASLGYLNKEGIVLGTAFERISGRSYVQTKCLNDRLTLALSINAAQSKGKNVSSSKDGQSVFDAMNYYSPLLPTKNEDGTWYNYTSVNQYFNPLSMINEDTYETNKKEIQGTGKATLQINKDLIWNLNLSYGNEQVNYNNYNTTNSQIVTTNGQAYRGTLENKKKVLETYFNYDHTFANVHKFSLMGGYSYEQTDNNDGFGLTVYDFYSDATSYYNLSYANKMDMSGITAYALETLRMISFYGRFNYSYNSKYLFQATIRRDGSSAFGRNNRWGTFPSASVAWRVGEEKFIKDLHLFDDLKFRVGYGVSGNSLGFGAFSAIQTYGPSGWFTYTDANGNSSLYRTIAAQSNANPNLKWERTAMLNAGVDFAFFGGRLGGTIEYYDKRTSDLIYSYNVSTNRYPYSTMPANVGDINNNGVEFTINATPIRTRNFTWDASLNLSHNKNNVKSISNSTYSVDYIAAGDPEIAGYSSNAQVERIMEGHPLGTFYTYEWAGYNSDGVSVFYKHDATTGERTGETTKDPVDTDRTITGSAQPKLNLGWTNNFRYKNWSLDMFFTGVFGNKIYNATREQYSNVGFVSEGRNVLKSVATEQKATDVQSQAPSDRWLEKGDYFRLSTLSLGYSFGKLGNWANSLKVYASCNNLFTITGYSGRDPEINLGGLDPGIDRRTNYYPRTRTLMLGVNVNF
jgi:TonB-dependent starch-binding outer membrane protein SusC